MSNNTQTSAAPKKNVGYRILAACLLLACIALFFLPISTFTGAWSIAKQSLLSTIIDVVKSDAKMLGFLPVLVPDSGILSLAANGVLYAFVLALVACFVLSIIAICARKKAPCLVRITLFIITWAAAIYAISTLFLSHYVGKVATTVDVCTVLLAFVGAILYFFLALIKVGGTAWSSLVHFILSLCAAGFLATAITHHGSVTAAAIGDGAYKWILFAIIVLVAANVFISSCRIMGKKGFKADLARYIVHLVLMLVACYIYYGTKMDSASYLLFSLLATGVAVVQVLIVSVQVANQNRVSVKEVTEAVLSDFQTEDYVEAYAYEGGPVAGVVMAEEVVPTAASALTAKNPDAVNNVASLLGNGFDPFLIMLSTEEKEQFIDLYVLKCKGNMPEIPGYVVGGDNKDFFNKVFIYLGQYREKIPAGLLEKMYKFSMKLS